MDSTIIKKHLRSSKRKGQQGFSLLEAIVASAIVTIGLVALLAVFAVAVATTQSIQMDTIARQRATQALESIFTARETAQITFSQIKNTSAGGTGIFIGGMRPLSDPGPDGLEDTADDVPPASIVLPGNTGTVSGANASSVTISLANLQRQVQINDVTDAGGNVLNNLRQVIVTVQYPTANGKQRSYSVQALISGYR